MERAHFRRLVRRAVDSLPRDVLRSLENVAIVIEREPSRAERRLAGVGANDDLFGLYLGIPRTERGGALTTLPDRIVIYQGPLERAFCPYEILREVVNTVRHEVAHHFGIDDDQLDALGLA